MYHDLSFEDILRLKYAKFQSILSLKECSQNWHKQSLEVIKEKKERYDTAQKLSRVKIVAEKEHFPSVIDNEIASFLQICCDTQANYVISFDVKNSAIDNSIEIVVGIQSSEKATDTDTLCKNIFYFVAKKHHLKVKKIHFVPKETVEQIE